MGMCLIYNEGLKEALPANTHQDWQNAVILIIISKCDLFLYHEFLIKNVSIYIVKWPQIHGHKHGQAGRSVGQLDEMT